MNNEVEEVELLLKFNSNSDLRNKEGKSILDIAKKNNNIALINILKF